VLLTLANGLLNAIALKKNANLCVGNGVSVFDVSVAEVYENMANNSCIGMGREILVAYGLAEWFFRFNGTHGLEKIRWTHTPTKSETQESAEEIIILFANMLQGGEK